MVNGQLAVALENRLFAQLANPTGGGGENIYPREIEEVINLHPAIANSAVIGVPDEKWGQSVKALVIIRQGHKVTAKELIDFCRGKIGSYKIPKTVEFLSAFPATPTGKTLKRELKKIYSNIT